MEYYFKYIFMFLFFFIILSLYAKLKLKQAIANFYPEINTKQELKKTSISDRKLTTNLTRNLRYLKIANRTFWGGLIFYVLFSIFSISYWNIKINERITEALKLKSSAAELRKNIESKSNDD
ncbi:hypothetical protein [Pseudoalteromonas denitrificans]|uniref:Uncharacterized protein n=1 Tax=Pseudoalteromonas denitrificans DSM 6059 TaxID=1123010 RepID=A0A1I1LUT6_9GAMM|nr:hypothetical protein [Pseudoalteromonas denitrificans]SFC76232.1 hypothetical protein SAMN02745724_02498 [Pseudoalteromonas denitrificans DSM 6059]